MRGKKVYTYLYQFLVFSMAFLFFLESRAQEEGFCTQNLERARAQFNAGHFYNMDTLLANCIKTGFNRVERIEALELLALSNLYLDRLDMADSVYLELLRLDPEHEVNPLLDPPDLVFLHNNFITEPVFYWSIIGGMNYSYVTQIHNHSIYGLDGMDDVTKTYNSRIGYEGGVGAEVNIIRDLYAGGEFLISKTNFHQIQTGQNYINQYTESNDWINIPLFVRYTFGKKKIRPYIYGGASFDLLLLAYHNNISKVNEVDDGDGEDFTDNRNVSGKRDMVNFSGVIGAGIRIKTNGPSIIAFDLKLSPGLTNLADELERYSPVMVDNIDLYGEDILTTGHVDDAFRLNYVTLSIRYVRPYYNPKKKNIE